MTDLNNISISKENEFYYNLRIRSLLSSTYQIVFYPERKLLKIVKIYPPSLKSFYFEIQDPPELILYFDCEMQLLEFEQYQNM